MLRYVYAGIPVLAECLDYYLYNGGHSCSHRGDDLSESFSPFLGQRGDDEACHQDSTSGISFGYTVVYGVSAYRAAVGCADAERDRLSGGYR